MSNVDPGRVRPDPSARFPCGSPTPARSPCTARTGPPTTSPVIMVLVGLLAIAVPVGIPLLINCLAGEVTARDGVARARRRQAGVGDRDYPDYGSSGYDVSKYTIGVDRDPTAGRLAGRTTINARADQPLALFDVDLALPVSRVLVDGVQARFASPASRTSDHARTAGRVRRRVRCPGGICGRAGQDRCDEIRAWYATGEEWTVAGEPESSAWWDPANDDPSDVADGCQCFGAHWLRGDQHRPAGVRDVADEEDHDTWRWISRQPMATYLTSSRSAVLDQGRGRCAAVPLRGVGADPRTAAGGRVRHWPSRPS